MQLYSEILFVLNMMIMGIFALGTAPGLLGVGGLTSLVKGIFAKRKKSASAENKTPNKLAAVIVLIREKILELFA